MGRLTQREARSERMDTLSGGRYEDLSRQTAGGLTDAAAVAVPTAAEPSGATGSDHHRRLCVGPVGRGWLEERLARLGR